MQQGSAGRCTWGSEDARQTLDERNACSAQGIGAGRHGTEAWSTGAGTALNWVGCLRAGFGSGRVAVVCRRFDVCRYRHGTAAGLPWVGINGEHITTWTRTRCVTWWIECECECMW
jgi:hypothetical protein